MLEVLARGEGPADCVLTLGYAGWAPGQLEAEIADNGWLVADASPGLVFGGAEPMWAGAMTAMGIDPLLLSTSAGRA